MIRKYSSFKETGFDWLGLIPSEWSLKRVGQFFIERSEKVDDKSFLPLSVTKLGIVDQLKEVAKTNDGENRKLVKKNDFVINSRSDRKGSSGIAKRDGSVSLINIVLKPVLIEPKFIEYLFKSFYFKEEFFRNGKGIHWDLWTTRWEQLKNINIPVPLPQDQKDISRYLDNKTEKIDSLIEKIEKKIQLLKEQKTSLINQYVTKGLDSNIEMKDSGINWLGEIPKHWKITKLKYLSKINVQYGLNIESDHYCESGIRFLRITDINHDGSLKKTGGVYLNKSNVPNEYILKKGDVLFSRTGGTVGKSSLIDSSQELMSFAGYLVRFEFEIFDISVFVSFFAQSSAFWSWINLQITQSTIQNVNGEKYSNLCLPLPPLDEIEKINRALQKKLSVLNKIINKEYTRKNCLLDYRQSLISAVVTGKIRITEDMI